MKIELNTIIKVGTTCIGFWIMFKGLSIGVLRNKELVAGGFWRLIMGFVFMLIGLIVIYFSDLYPPLTEILEPIVFFLLDLPQRLASIAQETKPLKLN